MKFSLLLEVQMSHPTPELEQQTFRDCVEQAVLADELGYHGVWATEHHGLYEFAHCSAPEVLLAFIAAKTKRLLLGHAVTLTPRAYNHPIRVAERVATLDILSGGRVRWGSGKSASRVEQDAFEVERDSLHDQWLEAFEMIPRMWRSEVFEWAGRFYQIPPTAILPRPVQKPHPPVYVACSKPDTVTLAGRLGAGSLNFTFGTDEALVAKVRSYRAATAEAAAEGRRVNGQFCCTPTALVLPNDAEACSYGFRGSRFFAECLATLFVGGQRPLPGALEVSREKFSERQLAEAMANRNREGSQLAAVIGDPVSARETVERFRAAGADELILVMQMGTVPQPIVLQSIRTFAEHVMPHFT
ncbi:MAG: LLM class flavin-dependent oxidoreductase [Acidobacteriota bacterium]|nr:LLM class flavin-dependent oxidoreductase [Acidobacteriota bacterium]